MNAYVGVATSNVVQRYADVGSPWWAWALVSLGVIAFLGYRDIELSAKVLGAVLVWNPCCSWSWTPASWATAAPMA
ncbi:hypothetical protein [Streptomyces parvulus]|uniref:hypothetical protein n=1 Tax=Streptomyces parvulus TaxID=146923 RepID=UPI0036FD7056